MIKRIITGFLFLSFCLIVSAQSDEEKSLNGVISRETWENADGKTKYISSVEKYDVNGNVIEEVKYEKDKSIKKKIVSTYNSDNNKLTETEFDKDGKLVQKFVYEYDGKFRVSRKEYNEKDKLVSWKTYTYELKEN